MRQTMVCVPRWQLCQHYIQNELQEDQSEATIEKAYTTAESYTRISEQESDSPFWQEVTVSNRTAGSREVVERSEEG
jgi:hypothetical protein